MENGTFVWDFALAPDNPNIIAVACADICISPLLQEIWISTDKGDHWENTHWPPRGVTAGVHLISAVDISVDFKGRKILVGTRDGTGLETNNLQVMEIPNHGAWNTQDIEGSPPSTNAVIGDILAAKFSPKFADDFSILLVYTDGTPEHSGTWLATGVHDISKNSTAWQAKKAHVEIKNSDGKKGSSPHISEIVTACLELPSDFHGKTDSHHRIYVSTDAFDRIENVSPNRGVYRIDKSTVYTLMDNTSTFGSITGNKMPRRVASIAYFGTCAAGKLLAGEALGDSTQASVETWFTDSPTTVHPLACWFPSLKPTTGAAGQLKDPSAMYNLGYGNAQVLWSPDGAVAFVATGAASLGPFATPEVGEGVVKPQVAWPAGYVNVIPCDESAFGISRSNGETWNQLSLINTLISKLTDVAPSDDGKTIYLASVNTNAGAQGFDSVWRSSSNPDVISPLPPLPIGTYWERVFTHVTAANCLAAQSNVALLRLVPWCADPSGEIVGWAAMGQAVAAWSPDFGEYWAMITVRNPIQDFTFETRTMLYFLSPTGLIQKMGFTGTGWSTALPNYDSTINPAHTIVALSDGKVLVGKGVGAPYAASISLNMDTDNPTFAVQLSSGPLIGGAVHVAFDPKFDDNSIFYIADESNVGSVYRNNPTAQLRWADTNMMAAANGAVGCPSPDSNQKGFTGIVLAYTGQALYVSSAVPGGGVWRTIDDGTGKYGPLSGLPKPGIVWDMVDAGLAPGTLFTAQPSALKACGCCTLETDTTLYAIDYRPYIPSSKMGMLWVYTDHTAKRNP
jgi:hypothetical protein